MRWLLRRMTPLDRGIVLCLLLLATASLVLAGRRPPGGRVVVEQDGRVVFVAPLAADRTVVLSGPLGETVLAIGDGRARLVDSPCPLKVCLGMGEIGRAGEVVACVPNHLLLRVEGGAAAGEKGYDLLGR